MSDETMEDEVVPTHNDGKQAAFKALNRVSFAEAQHRARDRVETERAVAKPKVDHLADAVVTKDDGTQEFTLKRGDPIVIEYPWPSRPTQTVVVWVVGEDGYLQTWNEDLHHFEFCNWRRAAADGVKLKVPDGSRLRKVRLTDKIVKRVRRTVTGNTNDPVDDSVSLPDAPDVQSGAAKGETDDEQARGHTDRSPDDPGGL